MWKQIIYNGIPLSYEASDEGNIRNIKTLKILLGKINKKTGYIFNIACTSMERKPVCWVIV